MADTIRRAVPVSDLEVQQDKREIVAYAAVFDVAAEVTDDHGHYIEKIDRGAFDVTLANNPERVRGIFNHARDMYGNPSDRFSSPYGKVVSMTTDARGLLTVTRALKTPLGDEVLEMAREGAVTAFSFQGAAVRSDRQPAAQSGGLPTVVRQEIKLLEFGPGIWATYDQAAILAVRAETADASCPDCVARADAEAAEFSKQQAELAARLEADERSRWDRLAARLDAKT